MPVLARDRNRQAHQEAPWRGSETVDGLVAATPRKTRSSCFRTSKPMVPSCRRCAEASVVRLVNEILLEAIELRASDVHMESQASGLTIRYRIDGMLQTQPVPPEIHRFESAIISRLKIMSRLNIAEPPAARRPHEAQGRRPRNRRPRRCDPDDPRRRDCHARIRWTKGDEVRPRQIGMEQDTSTRPSAS